MAMRWPSLRSVPRLTGGAESSRSRIVSRRLLPRLTSLALVLLLLCSIVGLVVSTLVVSGTVTAEGICFGQSAVLFAAVLGLVYVSLHLVAAYKDLPVCRQQALQHPLHAWVVILARLDLILWGITLVSVPVSLSRTDPSLTGGLRSIHADLVASSGGLVAMVFLACLVERGSEPFVLPWTSSPSRMACRDSRKGSSRRVSTSSKGLEKPWEASPLSFLPESSHNSPSSSFHRRDTLPVSGRVGGPRPMPGENFRPPCRYPSATHQRFRDRTDDVALFLGSAGRGYLAADAYAGEPARRAPAPESKPQAVHEAGELCQTVL